jgi:hypothetical protein
MNLNDIVTSYEQVKEPVERTYTAVTLREVPRDTIVYVENLKTFEALKQRIFPDEVLSKYGNVNNGLVEFTCRLEITTKDMSGSVLSKQQCNEIVVVENPVWKVIPLIFHGIGHAEYFSKTTNSQSEELGETAAFLYMDILSHEIPRIFPQYAGLQDYANSLITHPEENFHKKCADVARSFRPKQRLRGLDEKMSFLSRFSTLEQLDTELSKVV